MAIGRPSKLTPEMATKIAAWVEHGGPIEVAARAEGVGRSTVFRWLEEGREAEALLDAGVELTDGQRAALDFRDAVERARALFELETLRRLQTLDDSVDIETEHGLQRVNRIDPKIAAALTKSLTWLLERTRRERYGAAITVKVEEAKEFLLDTLETVCERLGTPEVLKAVLEELERSGPQAAGEAPEAEPLH